MDQETSLLLGQVGTEQVLGPEASVLVVGRKVSSFPCQMKLQLCWAFFLHSTHDFRAKTGGGSV